MLFLCHCDLLPGVIIFLAFVEAWRACFLSCLRSASALCTLLWLFLLFSCLLYVFLTSWVVRRCTSAFNSGSFGVYVVVGSRADESRKKSPDAVSAILSNDCRQVRSIAPTNSAGRISARHVPLSARDTFQWNGRLRSKSCAFAFRLDRAPTEPLPGRCLITHPPSQRHHRPVSQYMHVLKRE